MMYSLMTKSVTYLLTHFNLYNSVSYNSADMDGMKKDINDVLNVQCTLSTHCTHGTHSRIDSDVLLSI